MLVYARIGLSGLGKAEIGWVRLGFGGLG